MTPYATFMLIKKTCPVNRFQISAPTMDLREIQKKAKNGYALYPEVIYLKTLYIGEG
jgi:hypothetical protein